MVMAVNNFNYSHLDHRPKKGYNIFALRSNNALGGGPVLHQGLLVSGV